MYKHFETKKLQCCSLPKFSYFSKEAKRGSRSSTAGMLPTNKYCTHPRLKIKSQYILWKVDSKGAYTFPSKHLAVQYAICCS